VKRIAIGIVAVLAFVGLAVVGRGVYHLYIDHQEFHQIRTYLVQKAQQERQQVKP
jgi:hypothetical protein